MSSTTQPKVYAKPSAAKSSAAAARQGGSSGDSGSAQSQAPGGSDAAAVGQTEPQGVQGGLAETGTTLWPAAAGTVLLILGLIVLSRTRRRIF